MKRAGNKNEKERDTTEREKKSCSDALRRPPTPTKLGWIHPIRKGNRVREKERGNMQSGRCLIRNITKKEGVWGVARRQRGGGRGGEGGGRRWAHAERHRLIRPGHWRLLRRFTSSTTHLPPPSRSRRRRRRREGESKKKVPSSTGPISTHSYAHSWVFSHFPYLLFLFLPVSSFFPFIPSPFFWRRRRRKKRGKRRGLLVLFFFSFACAIFLLRLKFKSVISVRLHRIATSATLFHQIVL